MELSKQELLETTGGIKTVLVASIGIAVAFLVGIVDGYLRPLKCRG